jgi:hypothetical protein
MLKNSFVAEQSVLFLLATLPTTSSERVQLIKVTFFRIGLDISMEFRIVFALLLRAMCTPN